MDELYSPAQVAHIQRAYRAVFPKITRQLSDYWGLSRERPWSCLTTDFHNASYDRLKALHDRARDIDRMGLSFDIKGKALREASLDLGVGYSIGISPWTDNLLGQTYSDDKDSVVILLGHDWYPIVPDERASGTPLMASDSLHNVKRYWPAAPEAVLSGEAVGLFLNLYPDYRPPGDPKCGKLTKYGYSYAECLAGIDAVVNEISKRFSRVQLISWGANVWTALLPRVRSAAPKALLSANILNAPGTVFGVELGGQSLSYLPLMHPGHWGNFGRPYHLRHVKAGYAALGLGLPGMADANSEQVRIARQIDVKLTTGKEP